MSKSKSQPVSRYVPADPVAHDLFIQISRWGREYMKPFSWPDLGAIRVYLTKISRVSWTSDLEKRIIQAASKFNAFKRRGEILRNRRRKQEEEMRKRQGKLL